MTDPTSAVASRPHCRFWGCACAGAPPYVLDVGDLLDDHKAATVMLPPSPRGIVVLVVADPVLTWTSRGMARLAERVAGRVLDLDCVPRPFADDLLLAVRRVLDRTAE